MQEEHRDPFERYMYPRLTGTAARQLAQTSRRFENVPKGPVTREDIDYLIREGSVDILLASGVNPMKAMMIAIELGAVDVVRQLLPRLKYQSKNRAARQAIVMNNPIVLSTIRNDYRIVDVDRRVGIILGDLDTAMSNWKPGKTETIRYLLSMLPLNVDVRGPYTHARGKYNNEDLLDAYNEYFDAQSDWYRQARGNK